MTETAPKKTPTKAEIEKAIERLTSHVWVGDFWEDAKAASVIIRAYKALESKDSEREQKVQEAWKFVRLAKGGVGALGHIDNPEAHLSIIKDTFGHLNNALVLLALERASTEEKR